MPLPPVDPITIATTGLTTTIRLFEVGYQLKAVGPQTADLLKTVEHINRNIKEARRLREQKAALLSKGESEWMDSVIEDTVEARLAVARLIEPARVDQETKKSISLAHRTLWVLRDNPDVINKHRKLAIHHQSLTAVIGCLYSKDAIVISPVPGTSVAQNLSPPPYDPEMAELFERRTSRKKRRSMSSLQDGSIGSPDSSGTGRSGTNTARSNTSPFPPPTPHTKESAIDESIPKANLTGSAGLGLTEAKLCVVDGSHSYDVPAVTHANPGYLDESAALHALQHLSLANADPVISTSPPARPPKIPLSGVTGSQSNDIVERATAQGLIEREELDIDGITSQPRRTKCTWLAYHATRSDAGHLAPAM